MTTFKQLSIGNRFDFVGPDSMLNSFYSRCEKVSTRKYRWLNPRKCSLAPDVYLETRVGSVGVEVYHIQPSCGYCFSILHGPICSQCGGV